MGEDGCKITVNNKEVQGKAILLNSNVKHIAKKENGCDFFLLIDPTSSIAEKLQEKYLSGNAFFESFEVETNIPRNLMNSSDEKVKNTVKSLLEKLGVKEIALQVFLSESRLTHLFKEEAGFSSSAHLAYTCKTLTGISISRVFKTADF